MATQFALTILTLTVALLVLLHTCQAQQGYALGYNCTFTVKALHTNYCVRALLVQCLLLSSQSATILYGVYTSVVYRLCQLRLVVEMWPVRKFVETFLCNVTY